MLAVTNNSSRVTEFEFKRCRNPTIFPHPNQSDVQR